MKGRDFPFISGGHLQILKIIGLGTLALVLLLVAQIGVRTLTNGSKGTATSVRAFQIETAHNPYFWLYVGLNLVVAYSAAFWWVKHAR
jgi:hypothetical protein